MKVRFYFLLASCVIITTISKVLSHYQFNKVLGKVDTQNYSLSVGVHTTLDCDNGVYLEYTTSNNTSESITIDCLQPSELQELLKILHNAKKEQRIHIFERKDKTPDDEVLNAK